MLKQYIGDGVYADFDGWHIKLTTENGIEVLQTIFLEPEVFHALVQYKDRLGQQLKEQANAETGNISEPSEH
jgi:hypothetical protein